MATQKLTKAQYNAVQNIISLNDVWKDTDVFSAKDADIKEVTAMALCKKGVLKKASLTSKNKR